MSVAEAQLRHPSVGRPVLSVETIGTVPFACDGHLMFTNSVGPALSARSIPVLSACLLLGGALLACKGNKDGTAKKSDYTAELTKKLGKECTAGEDAALEKPEDGIKIRCETKKSLELAKTTVQSECANIKSHGFKRVRIYEVESPGTEQVSVKGTVDTGCILH